MPQICTVDGRVSQAAHSLASLGLTTCCIDSGTQRRVEREALAVGTPPGAAVQVSLSAISGLKMEV